MLARRRGRHAAPAGDRRPEQATAVPGSGAVPAVGLGFRDGREVVLTSDDPRAAALIAVAERLRDGAPVPPAPGPAGLEAGALTPGASPELALPTFHRWLRWWRTTWLGLALAGRRVTAQPRRGF